AETADWNTRKSECDQQLSQIIGSGYVGFDWHDAVIASSTCYRVAKALNLPAATIQNYANKTLALMRVLARDQVYGGPSATQEFLAVGDGATKSFTLRMAPATPAAVKVYLAPLTTKSFVYNGVTTT